jgi:hypothetical protein
VDWVVEAWVEGAVVRVWVGSVPGAADPQPQNNIQMAKAIQIKRFIWFHPFWSPAQAKAPLPDYTKFLQKLQRIIAANSP